MVTPLPIDDAALPSSQDPDGRPQPFNGTTFWIAPPADERSVLEGWLD